MNDITLPDSQSANKKSTIGRNLPFVDGVYEFREASPDGSIGDIVVSVNTLWWDSS